MPKENRSGVTGDALWIPAELTMLNVREPFGDPTELGEEDAHELGELLIRLTRGRYSFAHTSDFPFHPRPRSDRVRRAARGWGRVRGGVSLNIRFGAVTRGSALVRVRAILS